jgi:glycosyltransferase involved in cell wall biosynthesis
MKILHINDTYVELGGTEKYLLDLCAELERRGHQIIIISSTENKHISVKGRKEYFVKPSFFIRSGLKMWSLYREIIEKENPDVIHLHNTQHKNEYHFLSPFIIQRLNKLKPTVKFVHDSRFFCPNAGQKVIHSENKICIYPVGRVCLNRGGCNLLTLKYGDVFYNLRRFLIVSYELQISKKMSRIIVTNQYMFDELVKNALPKDKINILPLYTDKALHFKNIKNKQKDLILYVGRLHKGKGVMEFIEALSYIKDKQWEAEIAGDGELFKDLKKKVETLGLSRRVKFLGWLSNEEIDDCYQRSSMTIVPSMFPESFGLVGIEAMAFGTPVIAFDAGGIREWLRDGETGFLVERGDLKGLASKISLLLEDEALTRKIGMKARENVDKYYRKELHLNKIISIYEEIINERRRKIR